MDKIDGLSHPCREKNGDFGEAAHSSGGAMRMPFSRRTAQMRAKHSGEGQERVCRWMPPVSEERGEASCEERRPRNSSAS